MSSGFKERCEDRRDSVNKIEEEVKIRKSVFGTEDRQRRHNPHMVGNLEKKSIEMEYNKYLQV